MGSFLGGMLLLMDTRRRGAHNPVFLVVRQLSDLLGVELIGIYPLQFILHKSITTPNWREDLECLGGTVVRRDIWPFKL